MQCMSAIKQSLPPASSTSLTFYNSSEQFYVWISLKYFKYRAIQLWNKVLVIYAVGKFYAAPSKEEV